MNSLTLGCHHMRADCRNQFSARCCGGNRELKRRNATSSGSIRNEWNRRLVVGIGKSVDYDVLPLLGRSPLAEPRYRINNWGRIQGSFGTS